MKYTKLIVVFFIFLLNALFAQPYNPKAFKEQAFLKALKKNNNGYLPSSFFVIQASTLLEVFTNAPAIIKRIEEIKNYQPCPYILTVWKDDGGLGKNFYKYLKDNYYIDTNRYVKAFLSDTLYNLLGEIPNSEIHYFYHDKRIFHGDGKYDRVPQSPLPYDLIELDKKEESIYKDDENGYHTNSSLYYPINDTLAIELADVGDVKNRARLINLVNGKIYKKFNAEQVNYLDIFEKYFNHLNWNKQQIIQTDKELERIKRTPLRIEGVQIISPHEIYLQCTPIISKKVTDTVYIPGEYNTETIVLKSGDILSTSYGLWIKTDTSLLIKDFLIIDALSETEYNANNFPVFTDRFMKLDSLFYIYSYYYNHKKDKTYKDIINRNQNTNFIDAWKKQGNILTFDHKTATQFVHPFSECFPYVMGGSHIFFGTKENQYAMFDLYPEVYSFNNKNPITSIVNGTSLKYKLGSSTNWNYDSTSNQKEVIPFYTLTYGYILNKYFIYFLYRLQNEYYINVYNSKMQKIQSLNITKSIKDIIPILKEAELDNFLYTTTNYFGFTQCNKKGCKQIRYKIKWHTINANYLKNQQPFE